MEDDPTYKMFADSGKELFKNKDYSDAELVVGGKTWPIHKIILRTRSDWFKKALGEDFKEGRTNKLSIEGQDPMYVELVLRYLYTGEKPTPQELPRLRNHIDLLVTADYLQIEPLVFEANSMLKAYLSHKGHMTEHDDYLLSDEEMDDFFYAANLAYTSSSSLEVIRTPIERFIDDFDGYLLRDSRFIKKLKNIPDLVEAVFRDMMGHQLYPKMPENCASCMKKFYSSADMAETWAAGESCHDFTIRAHCHACFQKRKSSQTD
ncbi:BTB/POZ protein [Apiospora arundinis]|uniref:BTB/POZ protein n=1 Tax=Apiospora arundinis TaxID=335852 RepID=A0ABR2JIU6_9PEZI